MGSYNSQYQSYYSALQRGRRNGRNYSKGTSKAFDKNFFVKRMLQELIGVLCLFFVVLICKAVKVQQTTEFYDYCKKMVVYNYDYKALFDSAKKVNINELNDTIENYIDKLKSQITGEKTIKEKVYSEFEPPLQGKTVSGFGSRTNAISGKGEVHDGIDFNVPEGTEVRSCSSGTVKYTGEDKTLGKYIIIDHGMGIETKYASLKEIKVKKDDKIKEGDVVALSGGSGESSSPHLHFELLYMGECKNPEEYIKLEAIQE